jgi:hypothetical protein
MAFKAMNQGWGEASTIQPIFRELAYAADEPDERYDERAVLASETASAANDDDAAPRVGAFSAGDEATVVENAAGIREDQSCPGGVEVD